MNRIAMISHHFAGVLKNLWRQLENKIYGSSQMGFQSTGPGPYPNRSDGLQLMVNVDLCSSLFVHSEQLYMYTTVHPHTTPGHGIHSNIFINMQALSDQ